MKGSRFLTYIILWFIIVLGMAQLLCVYHPRNQVGRRCKPPGILMLKNNSFALFYPFEGWLLTFFFWRDKNLMLLGSTQFFWGKIFQAWKKWCWGRGVKTQKYGRQVVETLAAMENMFIQNVHPFHQKITRDSFLWYRQLSSKSSKTTTPHPFCLSFPSTNPPPLSFAKRSDHFRPELCRRSPAAEKKEIPPVWCDEFCVRWKPS